MEVFLCYIRKEQDLIRGSGSTSLIFGVAKCVNKFWVAVVFCGSGGLVEVIEGVKITESGWARRLILGFMGRVVSTLVI